MNRRSFLAAATASVGAVAGCSTLPVDDSDDSTNKSDTGISWPERREDSDLNRSGREWDGGYRGTTGGTTKFRADGFRIEVVGTTVTTQIGVYTGETIDGNTEDIPSKEFDWYRAPTGSYLWALTVNPIDYSGADELPPIDNWSARPVLNADEGAPKKPLTETYDPDPVYYRLPMMVDGELATTTSPAYGTIDSTGNTLDAQDLVFEVSSHAVEFSFGKPPQFWWSYRVD